MEIEVWEHVAPLLPVLSLSLIIIINKIIFIIKQNDLKKKKLSEYWTRELWVLRTSRYQLEEYVFKIYWLTRAGIFCRVHIVPDAPAAWRQYRPNGAPSPGQDLVLSLGSDLARRSSGRAGAPQARALGTKRVQLKIPACSSSPTSHPWRTPKNPTPPSPDTLRPPFQTPGHQYEYFFAYSLRSPAQCFSGAWETHLSKVLARPWPGLVKNVLMPIFKKQYL